MREKVIGNSIVVDATSGHKCDSRILCCLPSARVKDVKWAQDIEWGGQGRTVQPGVMVHVSVKDIGRKVSEVFQ